MSKATRAQTIVLVDGDMNGEILGWQEDARVIRALVRKGWIRVKDVTIRGTKYVMTHAGCEAIG